MLRGCLCCCGTMTHGCIQCNPDLHLLLSLYVHCQGTVHTLFLGTGDRHGQDFSWLGASDQHPTSFRKSGRHTAPTNSQTRNCITLSVQHGVSELAPITTPASHFHPPSCKSLIISGADTAASMQIGACIYPTCIEQNVTCYVKSYSQPVACCTTDAYRYSRQLNAIYITLTMVHDVETEALTCKSPHISVA